jgi:hypothetical protein
MSSLDLLKSTIKSFLDGQNKDRNETIKTIRKCISLMLKNDEDFLALNDRIPGYKAQYRAVMWNILLGLGHIDENECDPYISAYHYLSSSDQRKLIEEVQRIAKAQTNRGIRTDFQSYCSFLVLFSGFLAQQEAVYPLHQPLLSFGQVLLQHYSFPLAFMAFRQFVLHCAPHCFPRKGKKEDRPSILAVQIAYEYDPKLKKELENKHPEYSFSFNHISSFFTQMKEVDQVSIIFDFLFAYGAFMVIFIEAGWMYLNRNINDPEEFSSLPDAAKVIKQAILILKSTKRENIEKAKKYYTQD